MESEELRITSKGIFYALFSILNSKFSIKPRFPAQRRILLVHMQEQRRIFRLGAASTVFELTDPRIHSSLKQSSGSIGAHLFILGDEDALEAVRLCKCDTLLPGLVEQLLFVYMHQVGTTGIE